MVAGVLMTPRKISRFWPLVDVSMKQSQTSKKNNLHYWLIGDGVGATVDEDISVTREDRENIIGKRRDNMYFWSNLDKIFPLLSPLIFSSGTRKKLAHILINLQCNTEHQHLSDGEPGRSAHSLRCQSMTRKQ